VAYADLREFVKRLEKEGELKRIRTEVDPVLEITEVAQRVARTSDARRTASAPRYSSKDQKVREFHCCSMRLEACGGCAWRLR